MGNLCQYKSPLGKRPLINICLRVKIANVDIIRSEVSCTHHVFALIVETIQGSFSGIQLRFQSFRLFRFSLQKNEKFHYNKQSLVGIEPGCLTSTLAGSILVVSFSTSSFSNIQVLSSPASLLNSWNCIESARSLLLFAAESL